MNEQFDVELPLKLELLEKKSQEALRRYRQSPLSETHRREYEEPQLV